MYKNASVEQPQRESKRQQGGAEACWSGSTDIQQPIASPYPILCAHRGLSQACPENTLPAFAAAMAVGAHEIEFDVWSSRDGVPVICHDASVDRTTNGTGKIAELRWNEIRSLDAGIRCGELWQGVRIPRLEEVLDFTGSRITLNIHMKSEGLDGKSIKQVCDLLAEHGLTHANLAIIIGFWYSYPNEYLRTLYRSPRFSKGRRAVVSDTTHASRSTIELEFHNDMQE